jgi:steroid delta-isomerase-like uncharacterized protein
MTQNQNAVRRFIDEVWNGRKPELFNEFITPDASSHDPNTPEMGKGPDGYRKVFKLYTNAFPDSRLTIDDLIDAGDKVVHRWTATGTHKGELGGIAPTNRRIEVNGVTIYRFAGGKIAEQWVHWNALGLLQQVGVVPAEVTPAKAA